MKRRAISFITVLALCLSLCPTWVLAADWKPASADTPMVIASDPSATRYIVEEDTTIDGPYEITKAMVFDTRGNRYTASNASTFVVTSTGKLYLTTGTIESKKGSGIEVQSGGLLCVDKAGMTVTGTEYGLNISSGTTVQLSGGTFTGGKAAIQAQDYGDLRVIGYAYFDESGKTLLPEEVPGHTTVTVKECTDHVYDYEPTENAPTHDGICKYCGETITSEKCTFNFDKDGYAECDKCGHTIDIAIAISDDSLDDSLVYDSNEKPKPGSVIVTVTLDRGKPLEKATDYKVDYTTGTNAGETIKVTVSAVSYEGDYTKPFEISKDTPEITWNAEPLDSIEYTADKDVLLLKIKDALLLNVYIGVESGEDLRGDLQFSYKNKTDSGTDFIDGLPTNAGTYEIKASLPETQNYHAASSSGTITLTINTIDPTIEAPVAVKPIYNGTAQELVTSGAVKDGAEIQFAVSKDGSWSKDIPTGINAGDYEVWYQVVDEADNYNVVAPTQINGVTIERKEITPVVELEYDTCVYDGGYKEPKVTVRDKDDYWNALPSTEYTVTYTNNLDVSTDETKATVTVTDKDKGNYQIITTTANFKITPRDQDALTITNRPNTVTYGDKFTLGTSGGSGSGNVTWEITGGDEGIATVDPASGQVTVTGVGDATVQATKSEGDSGNHKDAIAVWTFHADKKPVVATVTAENKTYDGKVTATVNAVVEQGVVSGDSITITGLTGTFSDANAGTNKTVTMDSSGAEIDGGENYTVTYSSMTVMADIAKVVSEIVTPPTPTRKLIYSGEPQELLAEGEEAIPNNRKNIEVEYALSKDGSYSKSFPKATNAGSYEVWYRVPESTNYTAIPADKVDVTIAPKQVNDPDITLNPDSYVYDGKAKEPAVTVKDGNDVIPSSEYTVAYSNNVNVGDATVTVTDKEGGNYTVSEKNATFAITKGGSAVLTSSPQAKNLTYNGNLQDLVTVGTATGGHLEYSLNDENNYKKDIPQGKDAGLYTVYYKVKGDDNHTDTDPAYVFVTIQPKTVTSPFITLPKDSVEYNGKPQTFQEGEITVKDGDDTIAVEEYTVTYSNNVNAGTATVHINDNNGGNYTVSGSKSFEIKKAAAKFAEDKKPKAQAGLTYNAKAQPLITAGVPEGGTAVYSLDGENGPYSTTIPTGTDCGTYKVWAKVLGDANHTDSAPIEIDNVEIGKNTVKDPKIELSSKKFQYNGSEQKPTVTVKDDNWNVIPANEYTVTYSGNTINVGEYTITITSNEINYRFTQETPEKFQAKFEILPADQTPLTITGKPNIVYFGDTIQLGTEGGSGKGTVEWSIESGGSGSAEQKGNGQFIITGVGDITIKATRKSDTKNYADSEDTWTFHAYPKPVAAVVTANDKDYDENQDATLSVTVPGTGITITVEDDFKGTFDNADVGTNKTVTFIDISDHVTVTNGANYAITYPETTTASIRPADVDLTGKAKPGQINDLTYNGSARPLLTDGEELDGGNWAYSLDGVNYSLVVPKGTDAGAYEVYYKVLADSNHKDTEPTPLTVKIVAAERAENELEVLCSPETFPYDGTAKTPSVVVMDNNLNRVIPSDEYTVTLPSERVEVGSYTVHVEDKSGGNYEFTNPLTREFSIVPASQAPLSIVTDKAPTVYYGDTFRLSAVGGSGTGAVTWESIDPSVATVDERTGVVTVEGTGAFTITARRAGDSSYSDSNEASISFVAEKKPVTAVVTAKDKKYDGGTEAELSVTVPGTNIKIEGVKGTFADKNVGANKTVYISVNPDSVNVTNGDVYYIIYPDTTTASITPAPTSLDKINVTAITSLTYTGTPQALITVTDATTVAGGSMAYSLDGSSYSLVIPTGSYAGEYTVWYKVLADSNHTDSEAKTVKVEIGQATPIIGSYPVASSIASGQQLKESQLTGGQAIFDGVEVPGTFTWTNGNTTFTGAGQYDVTFTPYDRINYKTAATTVAVTEKTTEPDPTPEPEPGSTTTPNNSTSTSTAGSSGTGSASTRTSVRDGVASSVLNTASGNELVNKAIAKQSGNVVIKPEIIGDVTKTEVSIPASVVNRLGNETDAALTVSTPIADVTFPNGALDTMSSAGGAVSVITEQIENTIVLTLTANGKAIGDIPGGLTLTVSVENAGPGTVAVLIYEDGTRETVRRSVAEGDVVRIPLNGSVTVEIVDNSKEFADVPVESWATDAVAFASAHELFNGTGEATFSPEVSMSRAMLATVLYNLEGRPEQGLTSAFTDVDSDAWYAASISWAAANDITSGYGDGQFGPDDSITREQLAVMLWRYMGSPVADEQVPDFTDTDQVSSYAMQALCWAIENDILNGYGNGQLDPCGVATRAQVAQMLKNFIENT